MVKYKNTAFTLAEVLITLGIIGVVAAMTIPTVINKTNDLEYKVAYKKAFSIASQAWLMALKDEVIPDHSSYWDNTNKIAVFNAFKSYFKVTKTCTSGDNSSCWASGDKYFNCPYDENVYAFVDSSGMSWSWTGMDGGFGDSILVDANGLKSPNKLGQDRFVFGIPSGTVPQSLEPLPDCLGTSTSDCGGLSYTNACPNVVSHPCYYTSWLIGAH